MASLTVQSNTNLKIDGNANTGVIQNNANLKVTSNQSFLNLTNNCNGNFDVERSTLVVSCTSNAKINGKDNVLNMQNSSNINFDGNDNNCKIDSNANFKFNGNHGKATFSGNSNTRVNGSYNDITAVNNANLKISGDKNVISINETSNHEVKCVQDDTNATNIVKIAPNSISTSRIGSAISSCFGSSKINATYSVDYIKEAHINKHNYKVGIFKFDMVPQDEGKQIRIHFNNSDLDNGTFEMKTDGSDTMLFSACKNGKKQRLQIVGPHINAGKGGNPNTILLVNLIAAAGI